MENRMEKEEQHDIMLTEEQSVLKSVVDAFQGENMQTQWVNSIFIFITINL